MHTKCWDDDACCRCGGCGDGFGGFGGIVVVVVVVVVTEQKILQGCKDVIR